LGAETHAECDIVIVGRRTAGAPQEALLHSKIHRHSSASTNELGTYERILSMTAERADSRRIFMKSLMIFTNVF